MATTSASARAWLAGSAIALLLASLACDGTMRPSANVPIMRDFGIKIVYGTSRDLDVGALREHCSGLRGMFNECGSICAPGAEACAAVCAYTCENIPR